MGECEDVDDDDGGTEDTVEADTDDTDTWFTVLELDNKGVRCAGVGTTLDTLLEITGAVTFAPTAPGIVGLRARGGLLCGGMETAWLYDGGIADAASAAAAAVPLIGEVGVEDCTRFSRYTTNVTSPVAEVRRATASSWRALETSTPLI